MPRPLPGMGHKKSYFSWKENGITLANNFFQKIQKVVYQRYTWSETYVLKQKKHPQRRVLNQFVVFIRLQIIKIKVLLQISK